MCPNPKKKSLKFPFKVSSKLTNFVIFQGIYRRKGVLGASNEETKKDVWKCTERRRERCIIYSKKKVNEEFVRKMKEDVNGNKELFWKEVSNVKGEKVESCSRIKDSGLKGRVPSLSHPAHIAAYPSSQTPDLSCF